MTDSRTNPLTREREARARFCANAIVLRLTVDEANAVDFCAERGYLPDVGAVYWREGSGRRPAWRITRQDAYAWAEQVEGMDSSAFCACLSRPLAALFHAVDFRIRDGWAV